MISAIRALTWEILARHRWLVGGSAVWLLVACLVAALLPESARVRDMGMLLLVPATLGATAFIAAVSHGYETRLDTASGTFPRRLLRLPVSAALLGGVPLALAIGCPILVWAIASAGVLRPCGVADVSIIWPGLLIGVVLVWLLALCWSPMPHRWFRPALIVAVSTAFIAGVIVSHANKWPETRIVSCLAALAVPAVGLALWGVSRSRAESDDSDGAIFATLGGVVAPIEPFRRHLRTQLWLEWRTHGRPLLLLTLALGVVFVGMAAASEYTFQKDPWLIRAIPSESIQRLGSAWLSLAWLVVIPMILAGATGSEAGRFDQRQLKIGVSAFVGLMPISTVALVRGKFIASAIHLALMWAILLVLALGWAVVGGHIGGMADRLGAECGSPALACVALLVGLAGLYAFTYLLYVGPMWLGLLGSPVFSPLAAFVGMLAIGLAVWVGQHWQPGYAPVLQVGLWVALVAKLLLSAYLVRHDLTRHRVGVGTLGAALLVWVGLTALVAWMAAWVVDDSTAALAVVVLSPLASCLATPAVLHRSRHGAWA
jgi:hypothetical protein